MRDIFAAQSDNNGAIHIGIGSKARQNLLGHILVSLNLRAAGVIDDIDASLYLRGNNAAGFTCAGAGG